MHIREALLNGTVEGISERPERHIETVMSDVFIYTDTVRKIFKHKKPGIFVDLTDPHAFYSYMNEDFKWNQNVSPDIHQALYGLKESGNTYTVCEPEQGDLWFIEMKRVNDTDTLVHRLRTNTASLDDIRAFTHMQTKGIDRLTEQYLSAYTDLLDRGLYALWESRIDTDLRAFAKNMGDTISPTLTDRRIKRLFDYFRSHSYFRNLTVDDATITIDNHAGNVVFHNDTPHFIDIYLVKREWRLIDRNNNIARIAACVRSLGSNELAQAMYEVYGEYHAPAPDEICRFQEAYNAYIKGYYYTFLKEPGLAEKYFIRADATMDALTGERLDVDTV